MEPRLFTSDLRASLRQDFAGIPERALPLLWQHSTEPRYESLREWLEGILARLDGSDLAKALGHLAVWEKYPSALTEIATGELLAQNGNTVVYEPHIDDLTPDFLVTDVRGRQMIVEVWRRSLSIEVSALNRRWADLTGRLEALDIPVTLVMDRDGQVEPEPPERPKHLAAQVKRWLTSAGEKTVLEIEGLAFHLVGPSSAGHLQVGLVEQGVAAGRPTVMRAIQEKTGKYRGIANRRDLPLLVVLAGDPATGVTRSLVDSVMRGQNPVTVAFSGHALADITFSTELRPTEEPPKFDPALSAVAWVDLNDGHDARFGGFWVNPAAVRPIQGAGNPGQRGGLDT